jgi:hypothetical protein
VTAEGENEFVNQQVLDYFGKSHEEVKGWATSDAFQCSSALLFIVCETDNSSGRLQEISPFAEVSTFYQQLRHAS